MTPLSTVYISASAFQRASDRKIRIDTAEKEPAKVEVYNAYMGLPTYYNTYLPFATIHSLINNCLYANDVAFGFPLLGRVHLLKA